MGGEDIETSSKWHFDFSANHAWRHGQLRLPNREALVAVWREVERFGTPVTARAADYEDIADVDTLLSEPPGNLTRVGLHPDGEALWVELTSARDGRTRIWFGWNAAVQPQDVYRLQRTIERHGAPIRWWHRLAHRGGVAVVTRAGRDSIEERKFQRALRRTSALWGAGAGLVASILVQWLASGGRS